MKCYDWICPFCNMTFKTTETDFPERHVKECYKLLPKPESKIKPSHYHDGKVIDPIGVMRETFSQEQLEGFIKGNALKYIMRYNSKGNSLQDLRKAADYIQMLIVMYEIYEIEKAAK